VKIKNLFLVAMISFLVLPILADEQKGKNPVDVWFYFQTQSEWTKYSRSFSIDKSRGFAIGKITENISYLVETEVSPSIQLIKAQVGYQFGEQMLIIGQQSNSFKFYNPPPDKRIVSGPYPLGELVPTYDDLGITWQGKAWNFEYRFSLINGAGRNKKDDNKDKDTVLYAKFTPLKQFAIAACWQGGWQGKEDKEYRSGYWFQGEIEPFSGLLIKPTWVRRSDLEKEGWFILGLLQINSKDQLLIQYLKDVNKDDELTLGGIFHFNKAMRFLPNIFLRKKADNVYDYGIYLMTQVNIDKDL